MQAPRLAPDRLPEAVHVVQFTRADAGLVERGQQAEIGELANGMRQGVDPDADLADLAGLLVDGRANAAGMKHQGQRQSADTTADNDDPHDVAPQRSRYFKFEISWFPLSIAHGTAATDTQAGALTQTLSGASFEPHPPQRSRLLRASRSPISTMDDGSVRQLLCPPARALLRGGESDRRGRAPAHSPERAAGVRTRP